MGGFFYGKYSKEQVEQANQVDLEELLRRNGEELIRSGRDKRLASDHSITIRGNQWYDHAAEEGGFSLSFVRRHYNLSFGDAMRMLTGENGQSPLPYIHEKPKEPAKEFVLPPANDSMRRLYGYLVGYRKIDPDVLSEFVRRKLIYEDMPYHNAIFVGLDENGVPRHAHKRSTVSMGKQFRLNVEGSNPAYSFHWNGNNGSLYVFEAPVDLLSYISLNPEDWQQNSYVSLCGVGSQAMLKQLELHPELQKVFLCLDNDQAGQTASERLAGQLEKLGKTVYLLIPQNKDWSDDLKKKFHYSRKKEDYLLDFNAEQLWPLLLAAILVVTVFGAIAVFSDNANLNGIKRKQIGDGQHGTARWATDKETQEAFLHIPFTPDLWRQGKHLPEKQGLLVGSIPRKKRTTALIDTGDVHCLMIGASGVGKTAYYLYPNLEYAFASGVSLLVTDTKSDVVRNYGTIAKEKYGYQVAVIDLRNPTKSDGFNMLSLISKYADLYQKDPTDLRSKAKMEKYAKICAKTIIQAGGSGDYGQNTYFYDSAEGLLAATIMLVAEFCSSEKRHIVSVYKLIQELLAPSRTKGKNQFQILMEKLPPEHKARWMAGAALNTGEQAMMSVLSTAMSRLNAFLDTELEQLICFDSAVNAEQFVAQKTALFITMPEEDPTAYFLVSLILQQLYRELMTMADEHGGKLPRRCVFYCDELGTSVTCS